MKRIIQAFSVLAVLGFVFAAAQPAEAHGKRHHSMQRHHMMKHPGMMRMHHCHWMNQKYWSHRHHQWMWRQVRVCTN